MQGVKPMRDRHRLEAKVVEVTELLLPGSSGEDGEGDGAPLVPPDGTGLPPASTKQVCLVGRVGPVLCAANALCMGAWACALEARSPRRVAIACRPSNCSCSCTGHLHWPEVQADIHPQTTGMGRARSAVDWSGSGRGPKHHAQRLTHPAVVVLGDVHEAPPHHA